ncbi:major facilitator superfamily domain-containing protein [Gorgonomyces haynaldii]|nr:major facilitator superfamily domain-containing protein [Gorgonomyces haynaldii]
MSLYLPLNRKINHALTTIVFCGIQFAWTVELGYGTSLLLSLGLSPTLSALVWLCGPLSGLLMQPLIGWASDRLQSRFRRRIFICWLGFLVCVSMLLIAYCRSFYYTIGTAVFAFYLLDFSINGVMAASRALMVDVAPMEEQDAISLYCSRMIGLGNVLGYAVGYLDLVQLFGFGNQIELLCWITVLVFTICTSLTCWFTFEPIPEQMNDLNLSKVLKLLFHLPPPMAKLCRAQLLCWLTWFPFLFYASPWIASLSSDNVLDGARQGSLALLLFSIVSLVSGILFPIFFPQSKSKHLLYNIWSSGLLLLGFLLILSPFVSDRVLCISIVALVGIPWAIQLWIPFTLLGQFVLEHEDWEAGLANGIMNIYIVLPQLISSLIVSFLFSQISSDPPHQYASVLALCAFGALGSIVQLIY